MRAVAGRGCPHRATPHSRCFMSRSPHRLVSELAGSEFFALLEATEQAEHALALRLGQHGHAAKSCRALAHDRVGNSLISGVGES